MRLSNYLNHLDLSLQETLKAEAAVQELFDAQERALKRAQTLEAEAQDVLKFRQSETGRAHDKLRETSIVLGGLKQHRGELEDERFNNDEEMQEWRDRH